MTGYSNPAKGKYDPNAWQDDNCGHGTHVSGTIAGVQTGLYARAKMHHVQVFSGRQCSWVYASDLIHAAQRCEDAGATVISMSLGGGYASTTEQAYFEQLATKHVVAIAAAGNDGSTNYLYPASYDKVVSVAAVDEKSKHAYFSQANDKVDIAAPGVRVLSAVPGNQYAYYSGTSMATPHVSGALLKLLDVFPACKATQIMDVIVDTSTDLGQNGRDNQYGHGLIHVQMAFSKLNEYVLETCQPMTV
jgi:serine protease